MDIDDLAICLSKDFKGYFEVRNEEPVNHLLNPFLELATERIEYLMNGGYELDDAYEEYKSEIVSDIEYILRG